MFKKMLLKFLGVDSLVEENERLKKNLAKEKQEEIARRSNPVKSVVTEDNSVMEREEINRDMFEVVNFGFDRLNGDWQELQRNNPDISRVILGELRDKIFDLGIEEIPMIAIEYSSYILESYLIQVLVINGSFEKEKDNLDSLTREELISKIEEVSLMNYEASMKAKGYDSKPTAKMLEMLARNGYDVSKIKTYHYARKTIQHIVDSQDNTPTKNQLECIPRMAEKLGIQMENLPMATRQECSQTIAMLKEKIAEVFGEQKASEKQVEAYFRYLKMNNKRVTKKVEESVKDMTSNEISAKIGELRELYKKNNPFASEGQVNYIMSLANQLMLPINRTDVEKLSPKDATLKIRELKKDLLYFKAMQRGVSMSKEYINTLTDDEVKAKLDELTKPMNIH